MIESSANCAGRPAARSLGVRGLAPARRRERRRLAAIDNRFDSSHDVDTGGFVTLDKVGASEADQKSGTAYAGTPPDEFRRALAAVPVHHPDYTFIDFGSGKGRAVLLAAAYPFKAVVGVEFAPALHAVAERNLANYRGLRACADVRLECADATTYPLPDGPLVCYFYNPFQRDAMAAAVANVRAAFAHAPGRSTSSTTPRSSKTCWPARDSLEKVGAGNLYAVYRARPAAAGAGLLERVGAGRLPDIAPARRAA